MIVELNPNLKKEIDDYISQSFDAYISGTLDYIMVQINALAASVCLVNNLNTQLSVAKDALCNMHERDDKLRAELALARMEAISNE
jgi:hypothetical protein